MRKLIAIEVAKALNSCRDEAFRDDREHETSLRRDKRRPWLWVCNDGTIAISDGFLS